MEEYETFYDTIKESGTGVLRLTLPMKVASFAGMVAGDQVKVMIKKMEKKENE